MTVEPQTEAFARATDSSVAAETVGEAGSSTFRFAFVGALGFAVVALLWSLSSPLASAPDEPAQIVRAVSVARGELRGHDVRSTADAPPGQNRLDTEVTVPLSYAELYTLNACYVFKPEVPVGCAGDPGESMKEVRAETYVGTYPPTYYAVVGWPSLFLSARWGVWAMRLCSIAIASLMFGLALSALRRSRGNRLFAAGFLVAVTPMCVWLAGVVNPSGLEIIAAIALWMCTIAVLQPRSSVSRADLVRFGFSFVILCSIRPFSPMFAVGIVACIGLLCARGSGLRDLWNRRDVRWLGALVSLGFLTSIGWVVRSGSLNSVAGVPVPGLSLSGAVQGSLDRLGRRMHEVIGYFGYLEAPAPRTLLAIWSVLLLALLAGAMILGTWRQRATVAALIVAVFVFTIGAEAVSAARYGYIWQGRYTLAIAVGIPITCAWILGVRSNPGQRLTRWLCLGVGAIWGIGQALGNGALLRRNTSGVSNSYFAFLSDQGWHPPLPAPLIWVALLAGSMLLGIWITHVGYTDRRVLRR
jgi:hypothetical protein